MSDVAVTAAALRTYQTTIVGEAGDLDVAIIPVELRDEAASLLDRLAAAEEVCEVAHHARAFLTLPTKGVITSPAVADALRKQQEGALAGIWNALAAWEALSDRDGAR